MELPARARRRRTHRDRRHPQHRRASTVRPRVVPRARRARRLFRPTAARALAFFGRDDFQEVFQDLEPRASATGPASSRHRRLPALRRRAHGAPRRRLPRACRRARPARRRWWRQFTTLCRRYLAVLASDRRTVALLVLQAPVLGLLMLWRLPSGELGPPPENTLRLLSSASIVIFNLVIGATWIGMSSAAREIVRELPQFRRERAAGLSLSAYLASKVGCSGRDHDPADRRLRAHCNRRPSMGRTTRSCSVRADFLSSAVRRGGRPRVRRDARLGLSDLGGGALTSEQAMTVLPVVLIVQMVLASGAVFPDVAERRRFPPKAREVVSAEWGFSAAAATADLNQIQAFNNTAQRIPTVSVGPSRGGARRAPPGQPRRGGVAPPSPAPGSPTSWRSRRWASSASWPPASCSGESEAGGL